MLTLFCFTYKIKIDFSDFDVISSFFLLYLESTKFFSIQKKIKKQNNNFNYLIKYELRTKDEIDIYLNSCLDSSNINTHPPIILQNK